MGNRNWTPGPWKVNYFVDHDQEGSVVESAEGHGVATLYFRNGNYKVYLAEQSEANAARIVACVNALEGLNPEAVPEMLEALKFIAKHREHYRGEIKLSAGRQGDCAAMFDRMSAYIENLDALTGKIEAAIAKAEGRE